MPADLTLKFEDAATFSTWSKGLQLLLPLLTGAAEELQSMSFSLSDDSTSRVPSMAQLMDISVQHSLTLTALNLQMGLEQPMQSAAADKRGPYAQRSNGQVKRCLSTGSLLGVSRRNSTKDPTNQKLRKAQLWVQASMEMVGRHCQSQADLGQQQQMQGGRHGSCVEPTNPALDLSGGIASLPPIAAAAISGVGTTAQGGGSMTKAGKAAKEHRPEIKAVRAEKLEQQAELHQLTSKRMLAAAPAALHVLEEGDEGQSPRAPGDGTPSPAPSTYQGLKGLCVTNKSSEAPAAASRGCSTACSSSSGCASESESSRSSEADADGFCFEYIGAEGGLLRAASLPAKMSLLTECGMDSPLSITAQVKKMKRLQLQLQQRRLGSPQSAAAEAGTGQGLWQNQERSQAVHSAPSSAREAPSLREVSSNGAASASCTDGLRDTAGVPAAAASLSSMLQHGQQANRHCLGMKIADDSLPHWADHPGRSAAHSKVPSFVFQHGQQEASSPADVFTANVAGGAPGGEPLLLAAAPMVCTQHGPEHQEDSYYFTSPRQRAATGDLLSPSMPSMADLARIAGCRSSSAADESQRLPAAAQAFCSNTATDNSAGTFDFAVVDAGTRTLLPDKSVREQLQGWANGAAGVQPAAGTTQQSSRATGPPSSIELSMGGGLAGSATMAISSSTSKYHQHDGGSPLSRPHSGGGYSPSSASFAPVPSWPPGRTELVGSRPHQPPLSQGSITPGTPYAAARTHAISTASSISSASSIHQMKLEPGFGRRFLNGNRSSWYSLEEQGQHVRHSPLAMQSSSRTEAAFSSALGHVGMDGSSVVDGSNGDYSPPGVHTLQSAYLQATRGGEVYRGRLPLSSRSSGDGSLGQRVRRASTSSSQQGQVGVLPGGTDQKHAGEGGVKAESPRFLQLRIPNNRMSSMQSGIDSWRGHGKYATYVCPLQRIIRLRIEDICHKLLIYALL